MPHPMMTACGLSSLHRYKYKKVLGKLKGLKGGSAQRKGAGLKDMRLAVEPVMRPAVMPMNYVRTQRKLAMRS
jgi:GTPase involved in cell partitioning and DNA repair